MSEKPIRVVEFYFRSECRAVIFQKEIRFETRAVDATKERYWAPLTMVRTFLGDREDYAPDPDDVTLLMELVLQMDRLLKLKTES